MAEIQGDELFRDQASILASFIAAYQAQIPDVWLGEDGNLRILLEIEAGQIEGLFVANQIVLEDMFIQSANLAALERHGEQYGVSRKVGTQSIGTLLFFGQGNTYIPLGTEVAHDPGGGSDILYFLTTQDGTTPNPGIPGAPTGVDVPGAGNLGPGTYEYVITFLTPTGETIQGIDSAAIVTSGVAAHEINLTNIPLGGPGTTGRKIYRSLNGSAYQSVATINDNTTVAYTDNIAAGSLGGAPPTTSTAEGIVLDAQSEDVGLDYNVVVGAIDILSDAPDGLVSVTNQVVFTGGSDIEDIDDYRNRLLTFLRSPATGSITDIQGWAEEVDGVESATVFPNDNLGTPTNGHVTVRISGPGGSVPGIDIVNNVAAALAAQDLANITIHVTTFTQTTLHVAVTITPATGFVTADITANIQQAIEDYVNGINVGGTFYKSGVVDAVFGLPGVADVVVTAPASNQTAAATSKFVSDTPTVS